MLGIEKKPIAPRVLYGSIRCSCLQFNCLRVELKALAWIQSGATRRYPAVIILKLKERSGDAAADSISAQIFLHFSL